MKYFIESILKQHTIPTNGGDFKRPSRHLRTMRILSDQTVVQYVLPSNRVSFKHIVEVAKFQRGKKWKYASHLPEQFFLQDNFHFDKMNVQLARKILSSNTATALEQLVEVQS